MASLSKDGNGWRVLFISPVTKKRHTVRTGKCAKKNADTAKNMVEKLVEAKALGGSIDGQVAEWLKSIDDKLRDRLNKVGLVNMPGATLLEAFIEVYIAQRQKRGDITDSTVEVWGHNRRAVSRPTRPTSRGNLVGRHNRSTGDYQD